ncbi:MAG: single-stranded-DNA-specific exonuclease RecJ [Agathobacter sp.]|nr:single-stranded-DNA-specific exonuclease RecJ [Agathobacter sp.]
MSKWVVINKKADFAGIGKKYGIDQVTARVIRNRDVIGEEDIARYINGSLEDLYDPHLLKDGTSLAAMLSQAIDEGKSIRVIGDYDIDGVMSSHILFTALKRCGAKVSVAIPERVKDGYGLNINLIDEAFEDKVEVIITCDNGIAAINEIDHAKELGMTVLVTDHHEIPFVEENGVRTYVKSKADAVVNPHQKECEYPFKNLCGAAVAWKVVQLLYERCGKDVTESYEFLENVAFATVGDVMPLLGENRILVKEGLKRICKTQNAGMHALIERCQLEQDKIDAYHFGFVLGPCINASGRLDTARRALMLFSEESHTKALEIADELVSLNEQRKSLTQHGVDEAIRQYEELYSDDRVVVIFLPDVHESIAGIIAGRVRERYYKPTFVLTRSENEVKGSGRSIEEYSMYEEMTKCKDLFLKFGGHPLAAGLSIREEDVDTFRQRINEKCTLSQEDMVEKVRIDVPMPVSYVYMDLVRELNILAPFGKDNPRPIFADRNLSVTKLTILGKNSNVIRVGMVSQDGAFITAMLFKDAEGFLDYLRSKFGETELESAMSGRDNNILLSIVYTVKINSFRGNDSIQFEIQYYQ